MTERVAAIRYFEDVWPGEEYIEDAVAPTTAQLQEWWGRLPPAARAAVNTIFRDEATARRQGLARPIVPGNLIRAIPTRAVTEWMGFLGQLRSIDLSFRRPVHHGDRLRVKILVTDATDES